MDIREFLQPQNLVALHQVILLRSQIGYVNEDTDEEEQAISELLPAYPIRELIDGNDPDRSPRLTFIFNILIEELYRRITFGPWHFKHESYLVHTLRREGHLPVFINDRVAVTMTEEFGIRYYLVSEVRSLSQPRFKLTSIPMPRQWNPQPRKIDGSRRHFFQTLSEIMESAVPNESQQNPRSQIYKRCERLLDETVILFIPYVFSRNSLNLPIEVLFRNRIIMRNRTNKKYWSYQLWDIFLRRESKECCSSQFLFSSYLGEGYLIEEYVPSKCGHGSPCEQLCYELHDGMYECDCMEGFELHRNGYSCMELNSTMPPRYENEIENEEDVLYQKDASFSAELEISLDEGDAATKEVPIDGISTSGLVSSVTTQGPSLEQKVPITSSTLQTTISLVSEPSACTLECGPGGACIHDASADPLADPRCQCPLGRGGKHCDEEADVQTPRFTERGWLAFPALRAAYKHVQVHMDIRPEAYDGIFFLTGERDDMAGDFMALLLHQGFVEFRFDCGSGVGVVRSEETVLLNQWNKITLYRHRWDAWIQLNGGKRVQGRSKGLFSRITFREPLFIGGPGNTTGLSEKLPVTTGLKGCVRHLQVNEHDYKFSPDPIGDASKGFDVQECTADRCSRAPCQHGGKCLTSGGDAVCLCPLGFSGDLCETRVDLQVPAFNGSSYLRFQGLGDSSFSWLEIEVILKPSFGDGIIMFNGQHPDGSGDFIALYLSSGYAGFAFDLGSGTAVVRSEMPLPLNEWHSIRVSRTGRLASLQIDLLPATDVLSPGAFTHLSLTQSLYLGGVNNYDMIPHVIRDKGSFVGCIQKVVVNERPLGILAEALGGSNVDNCPHPCITKPCGPASQCIPDLEYFTCQCNPLSGQLCDSEQPPLLIREVMMPQASRLQSMMGAKFVGSDSYMHYSDAETMRRIISYQIDINLRFRTTSSEGLILWSGRHAMRSDDDFLALGIENGYLQLRYDLGSGEVNITYDRSRISDGLWHRVRAVRNSQEGSLEVDDGEAVRQRSPGKLRQLNTDTGLYIGGMSDIFRGTRRRYRSGMTGCIAELVLGGEFEVPLDPTEAPAHNVEPCTS